MECGTVENIIYGLMCLGGVGVKTLITTDGMGVGELLYVIVGSLLRISSPIWVNAQMGLA
jgi:hypothetical protein